MVLYPQPAAGSPRVHQWPAQFLLPHGRLSPFLKTRQVSRHGFHVVDIQAVDKRTDTEQKRRNYWEGGLRVIPGALGILGKLKVGPLTWRGLGTSVAHSHA